MPGEDLHRQRAAAEPQPRQRAPVEPAVDGEQDQRPPDHRAKVGQVAGVNVREVRSPEHEERAGQPGGSLVQTAVPDPEIHEPSAEEKVQRDAHVHRAGQGQTQVEPVRRIEQGGLEAAEIRRAAVDVRVPERQVTGGHLPETELPPVDELLLEIGVAIPEHPVARPEEHRPEHGEGQPQEERAGPPRPAAAGGVHPGRSAAASAGRDRER